MLARARVARLPILDGFVVPVAVSRPVLARGLTALEERNSGFARAVITNQGIPDSLAAELENAAARLGSTLVVRSSSVVEGDQAWAGAFASFAELRPDEVGHGVNGCWASALNPAVLDRAEVAGVMPAQLGMAVLVQRELHPSYGGVATVTEEGDVLIAGIAGPPAAILSGWERGHVAVVAVDGAVEPQTASTTLGGERLLNVAHMARSADRYLGCNHIEWAEESGSLYLLQASRSASPTASVVDPVPTPSLPEVADPRLADVVRLMVCFPGSMGERHVWPWALGMPAIAVPQPRSSVGSVDQLIVDVTSGAAELRARRWPAAPELPEATLAKLRSEESVSTLEMLTNLPRIDQVSAARQIRRLVELGHALKEEGIISDPEWMWHLDPDDLATRLTARASGSDRVGRGTWDSLVYSVIARMGRAAQGRPAATGWGAGRARFIRSASDAIDFAPRDVVVVAYPLNNLAPLLWDASALISLGGSPGAHLFEVAAWLNVPAVCAVDLESAAECTWDQLHGQEGHLAAVDGTSGRVVLVGPEA